MEMAAFYVCSRTYSQVPHHEKIAP